VKMDALRITGATSIDLPIVGADPSGPFVLKGAEGLGPPEVTVRMARTVLEKATYQGKSVSLRQIILVIGIQPDWDIGQTAEDLRTVLYSMLIPRYGQMLRVEVMHEGLIQGYASGQISKFEVALFSKEPAVQLTIDCDYGYFTTVWPTSQTPVKTPVGGQMAFDVENEGDAPSGFQAGFILRANVGTSLVLSENSPFGMKFEVEGINWVSGDHFIINTIPGDRGVWRIHNGGAKESVLNNMNAAVSEWLYLYGGTNRLLLNTTAFDWDTDYNFVHVPAFWGV
jgi:hypothetical protein